MDSETLEILMEPQHFKGTVTVPFATSFTYSNGSSLSTSPMDVRITFAEILPDLSVEARVGVVMPPEHAVILVMNLMQQMIVFEKHLGPIRSPEWQAFRAKAEADVQKSQAEAEHPETPATSSST